MRFMLNRVSCQTILYPIVLKYFAVTKFLKNKLHGILPNLHRKSNTCLRFAPVYYSKHCIILFFTEIL